MARRRREMKVTVLQRGGRYPEDKDYMEAACRWYAKALMTARMCNTLDIRIELRKTKLDKDHTATVATSANGSAATKNFTIILHRDASVKGKLEALAHEMIHVYQYATGILQHRVWKTDKRLHSRFHGVDYIKANVPWGRRPWEKEACENGDTLASMFRSSLYGRDGTRPLTDGDFVYRSYAPVRVEFGEPEEPSDFAQRLKAVEA